MQYLKGKVLEASNFRSLLKSNGKPWKKLLLSSYCIDHEWLQQQLPPHLNELILIQHGPDAGIKKGSFLGTPTTLLTPPFPQFPRYGVMHGKVMLMMGEEGMRVVVSTGNLMEFDYNGEVANILFVQDLPRLRSQTASSINSLLSCHLYRSLSSFLEALGCFSPGVLEPKELDAYDWGVVDERIRMVYSVPGYYDVMGDSNGKGKGLLMLNEVVDGMDGNVNESFNSANSSERITIEYQGSSLGAITRDWLDDFGKCALGLFPCSRKRSLEESLSDTPPVDFKIVFPSLKTVQESECGPGDFGTIFCKGKEFRAPGCPRECFYDCRSGRGRVSERPMHSKIMTVSVGDGVGGLEGSDSGSSDLTGSSLHDKSNLHQKEIIVLDSDEEAEQLTSKGRTIYRYLGSHNFTAAAWGRFLKGGTKLMINNYEVGVLLPGDWEFPYTYWRPPQQYSPEDEPWDQTVYFSG